MRKANIFYAVVCLLSGMALCLSGCGDDDPVIDTPTPDVPVEKPTPDPEPSEPETQTVNRSTLQFGYETEFTKCEGDSLAFYDLLGKQIAAMQDSVKNAEGSLYIYYTEEARIVEFLDSANQNAAQNAARSLISYIKEAEHTSLGFVYIGGCHWQSSSVTLSSFKPGQSASSGSSSSMTVGIYLPNVASTVWATADESAAVRSLTFQSRLEAYVNEDTEVLFSCKQTGYDLSFTLDQEEKYAFRLNTEGTEIQLIRVDGQPVEEGTVYTYQTTITQ